MTLFCCQRSMGPRWDWFFSRFFSNTSPPFHHTPQNTFFLWQLICG